MKAVSQSLIALAAAAIITGGCASITGPTQRQNADVTSQRTMIRVNNYNWSNMTVSVLRDGAKIRLGLVSSMETRMFEVPTSYLISTGEVLMVADPISSTRVVTSRPVLIGPGQGVEWRIENSIALSSLWVR